MYRRRRPAARPAGSRGALTYHRAMATRLSYDSILAALAVVGVSTGCAKSDSAAAAPAPEATMTAPRASEPAPKIADPAGPSLGAPATPGAAPAPAAQPPENAHVEERRAVDAGAEHLRPQRKAAASCGASGCSPDMKKGK